MTKKMKHPKKRKTDDQSKGKEKEKGKERDKNGEKEKKRKRNDEDDDEEDDDIETPKKKKRMSEDPETIKKQIANLDLQINKWIIKKTERDELKTVALGTSKINYLDPRISAAWCKRANVPLEKIFSKSLRDKFPWAISADENFKFSQ